MGKPNDYPYGFSWMRAVSLAIGGIGDKSMLPRSHELVLRTLLTYINAKTGICAVGYRQLVEEPQWSRRLSAQSERRLGGRCPPGLGGANWIGGDGHDALPTPALPGQVRSVGGPARPFG